MADQPHALGSVLVVDDEPTIGEIVSRYLQREGYEAEVVGDGHAALDAFARRRPDLVVLDVMMPGIDGLEVMRRMREQQGARTAIILLTARGEESDRITGLQLGADDYVVKPFSAREVIARIRAVLRRAGVPEPTGDDGPVEIGELRLDPARREVTLRGEVLELSRKEFEVLELLMRNAGSVVSRERLISEVWDTNWFGSTKTLDVHMSGIRRKLGDDPSRPRYVHTVRGVGFRFAAPGDL
jgi:DNA-binding response OmpR family regulator